MQHNGPAVCRSGEALARLAGHAGLEVLAQALVVEILADQHQLVLALPRPVAVVDGEAFARQVEHVATLAFVEPEDALGPEDPRWHLVVEEVLELAQGEGAVAAEGQGGEPLDGLVVGMAAMVMGVIVVVAVIVIMGVVMARRRRFVLAVAVVVVAVAVVLGPVVMAVGVVFARGGSLLLGHHPVALEQAHAEQVQLAQAQQPLPGTVVTPRFARDDSHFAVRVGDEVVAG